MLMSPVLSKKNRQIFLTSLLFVSYTVPVKAAEAPGVGRASVVNVRAVDELPPEHAGGGLTAGAAARIVGAVPVVGAGLSAGAAIAAADDDEPSTTGHAAGAAAGAADAPVPPVAVQLNEPTLYDLVLAAREAEALWTAACDEQQANVCISYDKRVCLVTGQGFADGIGNSAGEGRFRDLIALALSSGYNQELGAYHVSAKNQKGALAADAIGEAIGRIEVLIIKSTNIEGIGKHAFKGLTGLKALMLDTNTWLEKFEANALDRDPRESLEYLSIEGAPRLGGAFALPAIGLPRLRVLNLSNLSISSVDNLRRCEELGVIRIVGNSSLEVVPASVNALEKLKLLDLRKNGIQGAIAKTNAPRQSTGSPAIAYYSDNRDIDAVGDTLLTDLVTRPYSASNVILDFTGTDIAQNQARKAIFDAQKTRICPSLPTLMQRSRIGAAGYTGPTLASGRMGLLKSLTLSPEMKALMVDHLMQYGADAKSSAACVRRLVLERRETGAYGVFAPTVSTALFAQRHSDEIAAGVTVVKIVTGGVPGLVAGVAADVGKRVGLELMFSAFKKLVDPEQMLLKLLEMAHRGVIRNNDLLLTFVRIAGPVVLEASLSGELKKNPLAVLSAIQRGIRAQFTPAKLKKLGKALFDVYKTLFAVKTAQFCVDLLLGTAFYYDLENDGFCLMVHDDDSIVSSTTKNEYHQLARMYAYNAVGFVRLAALYALVRFSVELAKTDGVLFQDPEMFKGVARDIQQKTNSVVPRLTPTQAIYLAREVAEFASDKEAFHTLITPPAYSDGDCERGLEGMNTDSTDLGIPESEWRALSRFFEKLRSKIDTHAHLFSGAGGETLQFLESIRTDGELRGYLLTLATMYRTVPNVPVDGAAGAAAGAADAGAAAGLINDYRLLVGHLLNEIKTVMAW